MPHLSSLRSRMEGQTTGWVHALINGQRGALMPWAPVCVGAGVVLYFGLKFEPDMLTYSLVLVAGLIALALSRLAPLREGYGPVFMGLSLILAGFLLAGARAHHVSGPVLDFRYYGPIEGRVVAIDRSASDALRLTLDHVVLSRIPREQTPLRVRVSLHGEQIWLDPAPGDLVMMTGHLSPPEGAAEPGGFDFQRHAWFLTLGAVGYTRTPALLLEPRAPRSAPITHMRLRLSAAIQSRIDGQAGAFAAAVLTGDRSGLNATSIENMRATNIAHLLAISGLHMGLLTGFIYAALRYGLALSQTLALRYPIRKCAAMAALLAGAFYLALSGGNVATERAFIQVGVMFTAVMLDRRAVTLRSVAIAALIVLARRPETLLSPGFQMSFAATVALVAVFNALRGREWLRRQPKWAKGFTALVISSVVAGAATAPFAAAHFNQMASYGLLANLLSVPVMGSVVIPFAVLAGLLWPLGLDWLPFWVMEQGLIWILSVAAHIADWPSATRLVQVPQPWVLPLLSMGALLVIIWQGRGRFIGVLPMLMGLALWQGAARPELLVSPSGGIAGLLTPEGRALSRDRGDGFVAGIWLENDGDGADQAQAAARSGWREDGAGHSVVLAGRSIWHGRGAQAAGEADGACARHRIVIIATPPETERIASMPDAAGNVLPSPLQGAAHAHGPSEACVFLTPESFRRTGAIAFALDQDRLVAVSSAQIQGRRLWSRQ